MHTLIIGDDIGNKIIKNKVKAWHGKEWSSILSIIGLGLDAPQYNILCFQYMYTSCLLEHCSHAYTCVQYLLSSVKGVYVIHTHAC